ncbi:MAG: conjugal transfer protein TraL [Oscillospiraceae bacterium]|nr:conjugal transfer protein TraL [Oscillospiraceae bacterium]
MTVPYLCLVVLAALGYLILWKEGLLRRKSALFLSAALLLAVMALRGALLEHETLDYQTFLHAWVEDFRQAGGFPGLRMDVWDFSVACNYNVPYLYFLAAFTYLPVRDLYLIKLLSCLFDLLLAWGVLRLVSRFRKGDFARLLSFFLSLLLPTVLLNGAYWGQCDSIYGALSVWSLVFALEDRPIRSVLAAALSFAFKLQAVFLLPVYLVFLFARKVKWWQLLFFPLGYLAAVAPAVALGRPWKETLLLYFSQAGSVGSGLNYNSSSVYALLPADGNQVELARLGVLAAFCFLLVLYVLCYVRRKRLNDRALLEIAVLICVAVPYLLPHMHDRYFFLADVLTLALAVVSPWLFPVPIAVSFASLLGYHAYLKMQYLLPMRYGALALAGVIVVLLLDLVIVLFRKQKAG